MQWPIFALIGGLGTGLSWLVIVVQTPSIRYTGLGWLLLGVVLVLSPHTLIHNVHLGVAPT